jgi:hypothetical protein
MDTSLHQVSPKVILDARYSRKLYRDENSLGLELDNLKGKTLCFLKH